MLNKSIERLVEYRIAVAQIHKYFRSQKVISSLMSINTWLVDSGEHDGNSNALLHPILWPCRLSFNFNNCTCTYANDEFYQQDWVLSHYHRGKWTFLDDNLQGHCIGQRTFEFSPHSSDLTPHLWGTMKDEVYNCILAILSELHQERHLQRSPQRNWPQLLRQLFGVVMCAWLLIAKILSTLKYLCVLLEFVLHMWYVFRFKANTEYRFLSLKNVYIF